MGSKGANVCVHEAFLPITWIKPRVYDDITCPAWHHEALNSWDGPPVINESTCFLVLVRSSTGLCPLAGLTWANKFLSSSFERVLGSWVSFMTSIFRDLIKKGFIFIFLLVVYHLHGQTGRFTVWADDSQSWGLVNFVLELPLPFVQISSI